MGIRNYVQQALQSTVWYGSNVNKTITRLGATGGTVIDSDGYRIHVFTSPDNFNAIEPLVVDYLVVAGGGAGGNNGGGGGGAGGFRTGTNFPITAQSYPITVGVGGSVSVGSLRGGNGNPSVFSTITSTGGGGGGSRDGTEGAGAPGGSGGGGGGVDAPQIAGLGNTTPPFSPPQGNDGGVNFGSGTSQVGGGGGGAGSIGSNATPASPVNQAGPGGNGTAVTWVPSTYGTSSPLGPGRYFAGGGGGGVTINGTRGTGGAGGGGDGGAVPGASTASNGITNTGGGGGSTGGSGGSGIVIIRYPL